MWRHSENVFHNFFLLEIQKRLSYFLSIAVSRRSNIKLARLAKLRRSYVKWVRAKARFISRGWSDVQCTHIVHPQASGGQIEYCAARALLHLNGTRMVCTYIYGHTCTLKFFLFDTNGSPAALFLPEARPVFSRKSVLTRWRVRIDWGGGMKLRFRF